VLFWAFKESFQKRSRSLDEAESTKEKLLDITWRASSGVPGIKLLPLVLMYVLLSQ
jgi:hypothetical protein